MAIVMHAGARRVEREAHIDAPAEVDPSGYRELVFRTALAVCGEPDGAEDVAQEVLLVLVRSSNKLARLDNPIAWIRRVTIRCAIRQLRRARSADRLPVDFASGRTDEEAVAVYAVLTSMQPEQRVLLGMALGQGLSYREIAEALGVPEGTVASRLNAAKKEFQRRWGT